MFFNSKQEIISYICNNPSLSCLVAETEEIERLLITTLIRDNINFLSLRNIVIKENFRRKGIFTSIINALEYTDRNILIDDIINDNLYKFFLDRNYIHYSYVKNNDIIHCMIRKVYE